MPSVQFRIEGLSELQKALKDKEKLEFAKKAVRDSGNELASVMKSNAVFTRGYSSGATQDSITQTVKDGGLTVEVAPHTPYSAYLEFGTRFMPAQPFILPSLRIARIYFANRMRELTR